MQNSNLVLTPSSASKQHLAILMPCGPALVLNLLRWGGEIRSWEALALPPQGAEAAGITPAELAMAKQLIDEMSAEWRADKFRDSFRAEVMKLVEIKALAGQVEQVEQVDRSPSGSMNGSNVVDLTEHLQRSLGNNASLAKPVSAAPRKTERSKTRKLSS